MAQRWMARKLVADLLLINYDRTRGALDIYEELQKSRHVAKLVTQANETFIKLTKDGEESVWKILNHC